MNLDLLKNTKLFQNLSEQKLKLVAEQAAEKEYPAGSSILKAGEIGDCLHIILSGSAQVFVHNQKGEEIVLARLEKGDFFGEQALLNTKPTRRNANVRALTDLKTLTLPHSSFQACLNESLRNALSQTGEAELIDKVTHTLQETEIEQNELITLFSNHQTYVTRDVFFRQNDPASSAYYLLSGTVEIRIYDANSRIQSITKVFPGQFFGELAILEDQPRAAMAVALTECKVAVIDAEQLKNLYEQNSKLKSLFNAQRRLYQIPNLGTVTQFESSIQEMPALNTIIRKENGETILASRLIDSNFFTIYYEGIGGSKELFKDQKGRSREVSLKDNQLVGVHSIGEWDDLADISRLVYEKANVTPPDLENFHQSGSLSILAQGLKGSDELICKCMKVNSQTIQDCITKGANTVEAVSKTTGAGTVCGGCKPQIVELLGGNAWTAVKIIHTKKHNPKITSFQFQALNNSLSPSEPGQHLVIQGFIDGYWVSRSYTLTSTAEDINYYEITIKKEDQGVFSNWLFDHAEKDIQLRVSSPQGSFICSPKKGSSALCFMAGIGITPAIAFTKAILQNKSEKKIHIDYSVRSGNEIAFQKELVDWPQQHKNITIHQRITETEGHVKETEIKDLVTKHPDAEIYICGPKPYEEALLKHLQLSGISSDKIHTEAFNHAGGVDGRAK